jgi:hypothetical protein
MAGEQADKDHKALAYFDSHHSHLRPRLPFLAEDTVFGVKDSPIADFVKVDDANQAAAVGLPSPFWSVKWDFVLARTDQVGRSRA